MELDADPGPGAQPHVTKSEVHSASEARTPSKQHFRYAT